MATGCRMCGRFSSWVQSRLPRNGRRSRSATDTEMSVAFLPLVFSAVAFGPLGGFAVGALSTALDLRDVTAQMERLHPDSRHWKPPQPGLWWRSSSRNRTTLANTSSPALFGSMVVPRGRRFLQRRYRLRAWHRSCRTSSDASHRFGGSQCPLYVPVLTLFVYAYHTYSLELVLVFFVPTLAAQRLLHLYREEKDATSRLAAANDRLRRASLSFATALVATLDARDQYTAGHSAAVAIYARDIAMRMGLSQRISRNSSTSAASCTTLARSASPQACSRSPGR